VARAVTVIVQLALVSSRAVAQTDVTASLPGAFKETDTTSLLSAARIRALPVAQRTAWSAYLDRSRVAQAKDQALLQRELLTLGRTTMTRATFLSKSFDFPGNDDGRILAMDSARRMIPSMLSYQTPSGGWSKHIDLSHGVRQPGQSFFSENEKWQYIATIDNDAIAEVLGLLDEVANDRAQYVPVALRTASQAAVKLGVQCILAAQVRVDGKLTVKGQQHDPSTLAPASARSYELVSLTSKESAGVFEFLMSHTSLDARIVPALAGAAKWLERNAIHGMRNGGKHGLIPDSTAGLFGHACMRSAATVRSFPIAMARSNTTRTHSPTVAEATGGTPICQRPLSRTTANGSLHAMRRASHRSTADVADPDVADAETAPPDVAVSSSVSATRRAGHGRICIEQRGAVGVCTCGGRNDCGERGQRDARCDERDSYGGMERGADDTCSHQGANVSVACVRQHGVRCGTGWYHRQQ